MLPEQNDLDSRDLREVRVPREHGYALNRCRGRNERIEWPRAHASTAGCRDHLGVRASDSVVHGECLETPLDLGEHGEPPGALLESRREQHAKRELSKRDDGNRGIGGKQPRRRLRPYKDGCV